MPLKISKKSKRHHYIPIYFQKGFLGEEYNFFVYDKKRDHIFSSNPKNLFLEKDLNSTSFDDGDKSDFIEDSYSNIEKLCWPSLDVVRNSNAKTFIEPWDRFHIHLFISSLYWRSPKNADLAELFVNEFFTDETERFDYFDVFDSSGTPVRGERIETLKNSALFRKTAKMTLPLYTQLKDPNWAKDVENWKFFYIGDAKKWYLLGDNPVLNRNGYLHHPGKFIKEFIMPVSGNILLVNNSKSFESVHEHIIIQVGIATIASADRFVAFHRRDYLSAIVRLYKNYAEENKLCTIVPELFEMFC